MKRFYADLSVIICFFTLEYCGFSCGNQEEIYLLYSDYVHKTVGRMSIDGTGVERLLPADTLGHAGGITYDIENKTMYVVNTYHSVLKIPIDGGQRQEYFFDPDDISLNSITHDGNGHIYITEGAVQEVIYRMNTDGTNLIKWIEYVRASDVVVDNKHGYLIWTQQGTHKIERAALDDPSTRRIIVTDTYRPMGIDIDRTTNQMYWCEHTRGRILHANTDGTNMRTVTEIEWGGGILFMYYTAIYAGHLYITGDIWYAGGNQTYKVYDINIYRGNIDEIFKSTSSRPMGIAVVRPNITETAIPKVISSWPSFGPAAGGTWITVTVMNLPDTYNLYIGIGDKKCDKKLKNTTTVICLTQGLRGNETHLTGIPLPVTLKAGATVVANSTQTFTYKENPVIDRFHPKESITKGGTLLTVDGDNLDSVAVIEMEVIMVLKTLTSEEPLVYVETRTTYATKCQVANMTQMYCPTPIIDIPPGFLSQQSHSIPTKRDTRSHKKLRSPWGFGGTNFAWSSPSKRMKREAVKVEFSENGDVLEFYVGFRLDGVQDYENVSVIEIYTEPTFDFVSTVRIFKAGAHLVFHGEGLDSGIVVSDYGITIGREDCLDLELLSNSLSCYPPQSKPEVDEYQDETRDHQIIIHVGLNVQHLAGYLRYPDQTDSYSHKLPLGIIIPATAVPAVLIIVIIAAVCATKRRHLCYTRKNGKHDAQN